MRGKINAVTLAVLFAAVLFVVGFAIPAYADMEFLRSLPYAKGNIKLGALKVHPGLELKGIYDDNIFNRANNRRSDYSYIATPALLFDLGNRHSFKIGYAADIVSYADHTDENFTAHNGFGALNLDFPGGLNIGINDRYLKTDDPRSEERQLRASHWENHASSSIGYEFPATKLRVEASYALDYLMYDQKKNETINRRDDTFGGSVYYRFLPKSSIFLNYEYGLVDYIDAPGSTNPNSSTQAVNTGLKWEPTAKLSGILKGGWKWKDYLNASDPFGNEYDDRNLWTVSGDVDFKMTGYASLKVELNRSMEETTYPGTADYSESANYVDTGGRLGVEFHSSGFTFSAVAGYKKDEYDSLDAGKSAREDNVLKSDVGVKYEITKWLSTGVSYIYYNGDSNDNERDETHNTATLKLMAML